MKRWLVLVFAAACSSGSSQHDMSVDDLSVVDLAHVDHAMRVDLAGVDLRGVDLSVGDLATPYPAGPYGNTVGSIIPPLVWEGYADPLANALASTEPYGAYSMDDLRRSGAPYGVVHVAEFS